MKSVQPIKLSFWQKTIVFIRKNYFWVFGSSLLLYTWYQEKITIENDRARISEFIRKENDIQQLETYQRILQLQTRQTWTNKHLYDTAIQTFDRILVENIKNEAQLEFDCVRNFKFMIDIDKEDSTSIQNQWVQDTARLHNILATYDMPTITNWSNNQTADFAAQIRNMNYSVFPKLEVLNSRLDSDIKSYMKLYILSALFFLLNKIVNVRKQDDETPG